MIPSDYLPPIWGAFKSTAPEDERLLIRCFSSLVNGMKMLRRMDRLSFFGLPPKRFGIVEQAFEDMNNVGENIWKILEF